MKNTAENLPIVADNVIMSASPDRLIELAITQNADVDKLGKLMDLKDRWDAKQAKAQFDAALSQFQSLCPVLKKTKEIAYNTTKYSYAPLSSIKEQIQEFLTTCKLSYRWEFKDNGESIEVTCILSHVSGHSEKTSMSARADSSGSKNEIQQRGSTVTYMQRYTLIGSLGITSADSDDDGHSSGAMNADRLIRQSEAFKTYWQSVYMIKQSIADNDLSAGAEAWFELDNETKEALWIAPTKGGLFTTAERDVIKSSEFRIAHFGTEKGNE